jgi:hypothetical protein
VSPSSSKTFLVECYAPALDRATAASLTSRLRAAVRELREEGRPVKWLNSYALLGEETFLWILTAGEADDVALVNERAQVSCDHVVEVLTEKPLKARPDSST